MTTRMGEKEGKQGGRLMNQNVNYCHDKILHIAVECCDKRFCKY